MVKYAIHDCETSVGPHATTTGYRSPEQQPNRAWAIFFHVPFVGKGALDLFATGIWLSAI